jgi:hypothetical protein
MAAGSMKLGTNKNKSAVENAMAHMKASRSAGSNLSQISMIN